MALELLAELRVLGVVLSIDADGRLAYDAPAGVMTDERIAQVRADRVGLLALLATGLEPVALGPAWVCPFCLAGDRLADDPDGLRCGRCDRLAFMFHGESIVRADWGEPRLIGGRELAVLDSLRRTSQSVLQV